MVKAVENVLHCRNFCNLDLKINSVVSFPYSYKSIPPELEDFSFSPFCFIKLFINCMFIIIMIFLLYYDYTEILTVLHNNSRTALPFISPIKADDCNAPEEYRARRFQQFVECDLQAASSNSTSQGPLLSHHVWISL